MLKKISFFLIVLVLLLGCDNNLTNEVDVPEHSSSFSRNMSHIKWDHLILYENKNYSGRSMIVPIVEGVISNLRYNGWVSSIRVVRVKSPNQQKLDNEYILFSEKDAKGVYLTLDKSVPNLLNYGFNDLTGSIKFTSPEMKRGWYMEVYNKPNFKGHKIRLGYSNDSVHFIPMHISSVKLYGDYTATIYSGSNSDESDFTIIDNNGITDLGRFNSDKKTNIIVHHENYKRKYAVLYDSANYSGERRVITKTTIINRLGFFGFTDSIRIVGGEADDSGCKLWFQHPARKTMSFEVKGNISRNYSWPKPWEMFRVDF